MVSTQSAIDAIPVPVANGGTGLATLTANALYIGNGTSAPTALSVGSNGQLLIGSTTAAPAFATVTSPLSTLSFTTGAHSLGIDVNTAFMAQTANFSLTSAQIKALRATPITIVAAPASGSSIFFLGAQLEFSYGGSNVFTNPQNLAIQLAGGPTTVSTAIVATGWLDQSTDMYQWAAPAATSPIITAANTEAQALVIKNTGASEITGNAANDNSIQITVQYIVLTQ